MTAQSLAPQLQPATKGKVRGGARALSEKQVAPLRAMSRLASLVWSGRSDGRLGRVLDGFVGRLPLRFLSRPLESAAKLAMGEKRFRFGSQRPDTLYVPHLPAVTFYEATAASRHLEENVAAIRREFEQVERLTSLSPSSTLTGGSGAWTTFPLMRGGQPIEENIAICPETWRVASALPLLTGASGAVYFSIMEPGTRVRPHCGPSNVRARHHLTLEGDPGAKIRVGHEWRSWERDRCLIFDDSFEHEVVHDGRKRRVILLVDCWREELSGEERRFLTEVYRRLRS